MFSSKRQKWEEPRQPRPPSILAPGWCALANLFEGQKGQRRWTVNLLHPVPQLCMKWGLSFWHGGYISMLGAPVSMVRLWGAAQLFERFQQTHTFDSCFHTLIPPPLFISNPLYFNRSATIAFLKGIKHLKTFTFHHPDIDLILCEVFSSLMQNGFGWHSQPAVAELAESCSHVGHDWVRGGAAQSDSQNLREDEDNCLLSLVTLWSIFRWTPSYSFPGEERSHIKY